MCNVCKMAGVDGVHAAVVLCIPLAGVLFSSPLPLSLSFSRIINNMREIKTDVGHARAWVR